VFEYVSNNARAVGIAPPPFCESLTADAEFSVDGARRVPAALLMEFIDTRLHDVEHNYYVTIKDDEYSLQRKPSLAFERKEKERQAYEQQALAAERLRVERELASREAAAAKLKTQVDAGASSSIGRKTSEVTGGDLLMKLGISTVALMLCAVIGAGLLQKAGVFGWGPKKLSAEAEAVLQMFGQLAPEEQVIVVRQLEKMCIQQQPIELKSVPRDRADVGPIRQRGVPPPVQSAPRQGFPGQGGVSAEGAKRGTDDTLKPVK